MSTVEPSEMRPFWMVYGVGRDAPAYQHATKHGATQEAERLARANPGKTFVVLEAQEAIRLREFDRFDLRSAPHPGPVAGDEWDPIPF